MRSQMQDAAPRGVPFESGFARIVAHEDAHGLGFSRWIGLPEAREVAHFLKGAAERLKRSRLKTAARLRISTADRRQRSMR